VTVLNYVTITGEFADGQDNPLSGSATFCPNVTVYASGVPLLQPDVPVQAQITDGQLTNLSGEPLTLLTTDNSSIEYQGQTGFFFWTVQVVISGQTLDPWSFFLPHEPSTVDLWSLANTVPGAVGILPPAGDLGGTTTAPVVAKIQGTVISVPPGGTTEYLRGDGTWDVPPGTGFSLLASTGTAGYTLINGTGNALTWTAPADGALHRFFVIAVMHVTSAETGGGIVVNLTLPDATSGQFTLFASGKTAGVQASNFPAAPVQANAAVSVAQSSALTAGASVLWAEIWGS
jgi:hypothetical protein